MGIPQFYNEESPVLESKDFVLGRKITQEQFYSTQTNLFSPQEANHNGDICVTLVVTRPF